MQTRDAHLFAPDPAGFGAPWRRPGVAGRAAQTIGIAGAGSTKQGLDDLAAAGRALAASRNPVEILTIQSTYLRRAGERWAARSAVIAGQMAAIAADLLRPPAPSPTPAH